jgi:hypothetical protein
MPKLAALPDVLAYVRNVPGWFSDQDVLLLWNAALLAIEHCPAAELVEIGSYRGRSTVVLGAAVASVHGSTASVYAIDPHEGALPKPGDPGHRESSSWEPFLENVRGAGLLDPDGPVVPIRKRSTEVDWSSPVSLLFVDGAHDAASVRADWEKFSRFLVGGGFAAFHDYWNPDYPGVRTVVDGLLAAGELRRFLSCPVPCRENSLLVARKP